jgi:hypothetical protein
LVDWLGYNGFTVVAKRARDYSDGEGRRRFSRNMSIELSVDAKALPRSTATVGVSTSSSTIHEKAGGFERRPRAYQI